MELTLDQALQKGIEAHKAGKAQEADRYYTAIITANPKHPDANHNMGVLAVGVGKVEEALPFFKTALEANSSIVQYWLSYIDALIKLGRMADAKAIFDQAKSKGAKGDTFDQIEKSFGLSSAEASNIQEPPRKELDALIRLYNQNKLMQVYDEAKKLTQRYSDSLTLWNLIGASAAKLGQLDKAEDSFQKAILLNPDFAETYNNMGNVLRDQGKLNEALARFEKAILIKPDFAEAYNNMSVALKDLGKLEEAKEALTKALSIKPIYAEAQNNMGATLQDLGKLEEAVEAYNKALSIKPDFAKAQKNMGNALKDQGKLEEAIEAYNKALAIKPDYTQAEVNLNAAKNRAVPAWHISMMNDLDRNNAYLEALKLAITDNDLVLDIGTGSGLLAMMSVNAGAKEVITCEASKTIAATAKEIISENGYENKIKVLHKKSTDLFVGEDLPKKADIIVSEILSSEFVGEGVQATIIDANKRLIAKNGKMLPESGDIRIALIGDSEEIREQIYVQEVNGFDFSKFNSIAGNKFSLKLKNKPNLLSKTEVAFKFDLCGLKIPSKKEIILSLKANRSGLCYGIIQWLGIQIFNNVKYENKPGEIPSHWSTPIYTFNEPLYVSKGQEIKIKASLFEDNVWFSHQNNS